MNLQSADRKLTPIAEALPELLSSLPRMVETEEVPLRVAVGRILGTEVLAGQQRDGWLCGSRRRVQQRACFSC